MVDTNSSLGAMQTVDKHQVSDKPHPQPQPQRQRQRQRQRQISDRHPGRKGPVRSRKTRACARGKIVHKIPPGRDGVPGLKPQLCQMSKCGHGGRKSGAQVDRRTTFSGRARAPGPAAL